MRNRLLTAFALCLVTLTAGCAEYTRAEDAPNSPWKFLGEADVNDRPEWDSFEVDPPRRLSALQVVVRGPGVNFDRFKVTFVGGEEVEKSGWLVPVLKGAASPKVGLPEDRGPVERVQVRYRTIGVDLTSRVRVYGYPGAQPKEQAP